MSRALFSSLSRRFLYSSFFFDDVFPPLVLDKSFLLHFQKFMCSIAFARGLCALKPQRQEFMCSIVFARRIFLGPKVGFFAFPKQHSVSLIGNDFLVAVKKPFLCNDKENSEASLFATIKRTARYQAGFDLR